jgi:hypothetical protein
MERRTPILGARIFQMSRGDSNQPHERIFIMMEYDHLLGNG